MFKRVFLQRFKTIPNQIFSPFITLSLSRDEPDNCDSPPLKLSRRLMSRTQHCFDHSVFVYKDKRGCYDNPKRQEIKEKICNWQIQILVTKKKTSNGKLPPRSRLCVNHWVLSDMGLFSPPVLKNVVNVDIHLVTLAK